VKKNLIGGRNWGKWGKRENFALASGEEANNREKAHEVYCTQEYYCNIYYPF